MKIEHIWPSTVRKSSVPGYDHPPYGQVVQITRASGERSIHIAGTFGTDVDGNIAENDMHAQAKQAHENLRLCMEAVGGTVADIVRVKIYVTDMERYLTEAMPVEMETARIAPAASTLVEISRLANPKAMVEIEAYAELDATE